MAIAAKEKVERLQAMDVNIRSKTLLDIADALEANEKVIVHENEVDVSSAQNDGYESLLASQLALNPMKASHKLGLWRKTQSDGQELDYNQEEGRSLRRLYGFGSFAKAISMINGTTEPCYIPDKNDELEELRELVRKQKEQNKEVKEIMKAKDEQHNIKCEQLERQLQSTMMVINTFKEPQK